MTRNVKTYIFLDLEATGLPGPGSYPRITEISMVAVHHVCLTGTDTTSRDLPRVINKFTMCVCPRKLIPPSVTKITGLQNDHLERQKDFDAELADMITAFIQRHEPPVCLVAHNGDNYDFGLLKAEFESVGRALPADLMRVDSLRMFRALDEMCSEDNKLTAPRKHPGYTTPVKHCAAVDFAVPSAVKRKLFSGDIDGAVAEDADGVNGDKRMRSENEAQPAVGGNACPAVCADNNAGQTPPAAPNFWEELRSGQSLEDDVLSSLHLPGELKTHASLGNAANVPTQAASDSTRRAAQSPSSNTSSPARLSYKLCEIHKRVMGYVTPNAHSAEDDALALARLFHKLSSVVCHWMEENAESLDEVAPMYTGKRRSPLPQGAFPYNCPV